MDILKRVCDLLEQDVALALATVIKTTGSTPRKAGAKMIVFANGSHEGTLGGGQLEQYVIESGVLAIEEMRCKVIEVNLSGSHSQMACGGQATIFIEPMSRKSRLFVLGAGHVGRALCKASAFAGFIVALLDDRANFTQKGDLPDSVRAFQIDDFSKPFEGIPLSVTPDDFVVICTRAHESDLDALRASLRSPARFIGLLGSRRKKEQFFDKLKDEGFSASQISRVKTPVGLPIGAQTPEEIAISITAQLLEEKARLHKKC